MKILAIGDPHGKTSNLPKENFDLIITTGDLGDATLAREFYFNNLKLRQKGLSEISLTKTNEKKIENQTQESTKKILKNLSKLAPTYTLEGNVEIDKINSLNKKKNISIVKNQLRVIKEIRIGFLDYFLDTSWAKEFKPKDKEALEKARKETKKATKILKRFKNLDILVCHQPPYKILDKVSKKYNPPKNWIGKNAGSKLILDFIKNQKPKTVLCGHIHECKGKKIIGKTIVYNLGHSGDYKVLNI